MPLQLPAAVSGVFLWLQLVAEVDQVRPSAVKRRARGTRGTRGSKMANDARASGIRLGGLCSALNRQIASVDTVGVVYECVGPRNSEYLGHRSVAARSKTLLLSSSPAQLEALSNAGHGNGGARAPLSIRM